jgi:predicted ribosome quality control (RQC) complex YloA/Tae2 family protein
MDVFFLEAIVAEAHPLVAGSSVKKVHQPDADTIIFRLWNGRQELCLRINASVGATGLFFTERPWINPETPMRFCQLLRSRLRTLRSIQQLPHERIVFLTFDGQDAATYRLVCELYGRRPNMILCDDNGRIVDVLHRREGEVDQQTYMKGAIWSQPEKGEGYSLEEAAACWTTEVKGVSPVEWLKHNVRPMTPLVARELASLLDRGGDPAKILLGFARHWRQRHYTFQIAELNDSPRLFAFQTTGLRLTSVQTFSSASVAADSFFSDYASPGRSGEKSRLLKVVRRALSRVEKRLDRLHQDKSRTGEVEQLQQHGQLLLANLHRIRKGMHEIEVENFYEQGTTVTIPLDEAISPFQNVDRLFTKCKKIRRGYEHVERRLSESLDEKEWLEAVLLSLGEATTREELAAIEEEMRDLGLLPRNAPRPRRRNGRGLPKVREGVSPGGFIMQWGTNNRANDYLVKHVCRALDLWFHVLGQPGCHLVLKNPRQGPGIPEEDIFYAASLAAGYSRAASERSAEVMVAEGRAVHKPKGALPGLVQVKSYRTVRVAPRRES